MKLRVGPPRLRAFVTAAVMRATVSAATLGVTVTAPMIRIRATLGRFFSRLPQTDGVSIVQDRYFAEDYVLPGYIVAPFSLELTKPQASAVGVTDDITIIGPAKGVTDIVSAGDAVAISASLSIMDAPTVGDSGFINIQDYCDIDYFAEGYVGEVRTF